LILNGKYFVPPEDNPEDFKPLFRRLAAAGAGRRVDADSLPQGPWTPNLLAEAITSIDANRKGIELRTVQLWFQDNQKGVSAENVRWLARIFGCGDAEATGNWQRKLRASLDLLAENRRADRRRARLDERRDAPPRPPRSDALAGAAPVAARGPAWAVGLAGWSERIFGAGEPLNLPASIFAGAVALQFISYLVGNHSITYVRADGVEKQVGFHWATNWTFLFMLFLPLFVIFAGDIVTFWRTRGRAALLPKGDRASATDGWMLKVQRSRTTFWAVLLTCLGFAGLVQWIGGRLLPLRSGIDDDAMDWASVALVRPDVVSISEAIAFSGLAYAYMAACFYLMFAGLILLYTLADDYWHIMTRARHAGPVEAEVARKILDGLFRCSAAGLLIAICMIAQARFLPSDALDVWAWLFADVASIWRGVPAGGVGDGFGVALHYTSLLVALPSCVVMIYGIVRVGMPAGHRDRWLRMAIALAVIVAGYLLTGAFPGFSALLALAVLLALYGLFDPGYGARPPRRNAEGRHAS
jgi:hypothetical protein